MKYPSTKCFSFGHFLHNSEFHIDHFSPSEGPKMEILKNLKCIWGPPWEKPTNQILSTMSNQNTSTDGKSKITLWMQQWKLHLPHWCPCFSHEFYNCVILGFFSEDVRKLRSCNKAHYESSWKYKKSTWCAQTGTNEHNCSSWCYNIG